MKTIPLAFLGFFVWMGASMAEAGKLPASGKLVYTMTTKGEGPEKAAKTTIYWKGSMIRMERSLKEGGNWLISDGKTAYEYDRKEGVATQLRDLPRLEAHVATISPNLQPKKKGTGTARGEACDILRGEPKGGSGKADFWVSKRTGIILKMVAYTPLGEITRQVTELKTGTKPADSLFKIPKGVTIKQQRIPKVLQ